MELTELDEAKMKVMKEIADSNLILSGLKADVRKMEADKEKFFQTRVDQLTSRLSEFLRDSRNLVVETEANFTQVHNFYEELKKFADTVKELSWEVEEQFKELETQVLVATDLIDTQIKEFSEIRKKINHDFTVIEREKSFIKTQREQLEQDKAKHRVQAANLQVALEALKRKK